MLLPNLHGSTNNFQGCCHFCAHLPGAVNVVLCPCKTALHKNHIWPVSIAAELEDLSGTLEVWMQDSLGINGEKSAIKTATLLYIWLVNQNSEGRMLYFNKRLIQHKLVACFNLKEHSMISFFWFTPHTQLFERSLVCFIVRNYYKLWVMSSSHKPGNSSADIHMYISTRKIQFLCEVMQFKWNCSQIILDVFLLRAHYRLFFSWLLVPLH